MMLAAEVGTLTDEQLAVLEVAAIIHDVGKIGIPDNILLSQDALTEAEYEIMKSHSSAGSRIVLASGLDGCEEVAAVIVQTHEHFDGSGYPDHLSGDSIAFSARILAVADGFDAMTQERSYKRAFSIPETLMIMRGESGATYDPCVVSALLSIFSKNDSMVKVNLCLPSET